MKKMYNITYDVLKPWMLDPEIQYENPWDVYMNTSYILNKDIFIELGINDGLNTTIKLELGTNTITNDSIRGKYGQSFGLSSLLVH